jgi:hypothetical protein
MKLIMNQRKRATEVKGEEYQRGLVGLEGGEGDQAEKRGEEGGELGNGMGGEGEWRDMKEAFVSFEEFVEDRKSQKHHGCCAQDVGESQAQRRE